MALGVGGDYGRRRRTGLVSAVMAVLLMANTGTSTLALRLLQHLPVDRVIDANAAESRLMKAGIPPQSASGDYDEADEPMSTENITMAARLPAVGPMNMPAGFSDGKSSQCYDDLKEASGDGNTVTQDDFPHFLQLFSKGQLPYTTASQIPAVYKKLFDATACFNIQNCTSSQPVISLDMEDSSAAWLETFCDQIQWYMSNSTVISFDYSVRYDPLQVSIEKLRTCLSRATENVLNTQFGCDGNYSDTDSRRLSVLPRKENNSPRNALIHPQPRPNVVRFLPDNGLPTFQKPPSLASETGSKGDCPYVISHQVDEIIHLPCSPNAGGLRISPSVCGLVQNTVTVMAAQSDSVRSEELYKDVTSILRETIDSKTFETYFPSACLLAH